MSRARSASPSTFILEGGQVFCSGVAEIGLGTQGLGEQASRTVKERDDAHLRAYFEERDAKVREQEAREQMRLAKLQKNQELSPRKRLEQVMEAREEEIARMTRERKAFETAAKEKRAQEAAEKNARIHEQKEMVQQQLAEAKQRRLLKMESDKKAIRAERSTALARLREEEEQQALALQEHHTQLRHWHEVCKARAAEEARLRLEEKEAAVREQKMIHETKKANIQKVVEEIVTLKSDLIKSVKEELKAGRVVFEKREDRLVENAKTIKQDIKTRDAEKKAQIAAVRAEKKKLAAEAKDEAARRQEEYFKAKNDQKRVLSEQAKLQREQARQSILNERDAVRQERLERFELNKAAIQRSKSATPTHH